MLRPGRIYRRNLMRIAIYSHVFPPAIGGSGVHARLLADEIAGHNHLVTVVTPTIGGSESQYTSDSFEIVRRPRFRQLLAVLAHSDLVLTIGPCLKAGILARAMRKPLIVAHAMFPAQGTRGVSRTSVQRRPNIVPSSALRYALPRPTTVVPHPYDESVFWKRTTTANRQHDIVFVGQLIKEKGLRNVLLALDLLQRKGLMLGLTVVGSGPEAETLANSRGVLA